MNVEFLFERQHQIQVLHGVPGFNGIHRGIGANAFDGHGEYIGRDLPNAIEGPYRQERSPLFTLSLIQSGQAICCSCKLRIHCEPSPSRRWHLNPD